MAVLRARDARADAGRTQAEARELVVELVRNHADTLLRVARRHSICADDAQDAYQRGLEILLRHATRLELDGAPGWLHTVVKHEALAINRSRRRLVSADGADPDDHESLTTASPEERAIGADRIARSAEVLRRLKPHEAQALWLKALGNSYEQICESTGWSYTKVNRCIAEGRRSFLERYASIEQGEECERWEGVLSAMVDGEATSEQLIEVRPHLRNCLACRALVREMHDSSAQLAALFPVVGLAHVAGGLEAVPGAAVRIYETVAMYVQERATTSAIRLQALFEAATTTKVAAVAASAVAVAGGGVVVDEARRSPAASDVIVQRARPAAGRSTSVALGYPTNPAAASRLRASARLSAAVDHTTTRSPDRRAASAPGTEFVPPGANPAPGKATVLAPVAGAATVAAPDPGAPRASSDAPASSGATEFAPAP